MSIQFRWFGVAGLEFHVDDQILLIDPFFTRPPIQNLFFGRVAPNRELTSQHISRADAILITHAHYDHLMDVPDVARITSATVYGSRNSCQLLELLGVPRVQIREIHVADELSLGNFQVTVLAAQHMRLPLYTPGVLPHTTPISFGGVLRLRDYVMDECFSFLIRAGDVHLLDWAGVSLPSVNAEVLFTHAFQNQAHNQSLVAAVNPRTVVPIHWDDFFRPLSQPLVPFFSPPHPPFPFVRRINLHEFKQSIESELPKTRVQIPEGFRVYDISSEK